MKVASFFTGAGGLDRGFENAGFEIAYANEYDKTIWDTYRHNFPKTHLDQRSIVEIEIDDVDDCDGMIGGPPCQSWSEAGALRGIADARGQLFFEYIRILEGKRPLFFLAENVSGILFNRHQGAFEEILGHFARLGYNVSYGLLNANHYGVPQDRERVIVARWFSGAARYFTKKIGAAVVLLDHVTKANTRNRDNNHAAGSLRKRAAIDGAAYSLHVITPASRTSDGEFEFIT